MADESLPTVEWVAYTRTKAERLLGSNSHNRQLRSTVVRRYANDMAAGDWLLTGETIKIDSDGVLRDGQHRLAAIVQAADNGYTRPVKILTVYGVAGEVQNVTDTGLKRTPADVLHLAGIKNSSMLSSTIRCIIRLETGRIFDARGSQQAVSNSEMLRWLERNPPIMAFIDQHAWSLRKTNMPPSPAAAGLWMLHNHDPYKAAEFLDGLSTLAQLPKGSPIAALAQQISTLRINRSRLEQVEWIGMMFSAWNAWCGGRAAPSFNMRRYVEASFPWPLSPTEALRRAENAAGQRERRHLEAV